MIDTSFSVLALPKSVPLRSLGKYSQPSGYCSETSDIDSRSSSPRAHGHASQQTFKVTRDELLEQQRQEALSREALEASEWICSEGWWPPTATSSPKSACSTPGCGLNSSTSSRSLYMRLFGDAKLAARLRGSAAVPGSPREHPLSHLHYQQQAAPLGSHHCHDFSRLRYHRRATDPNLAPGAGPSSSTSNSRAGCRTSLAAAAAAAAVVATGRTPSGLPMCRGGSISKAKQVLALAMNMSSGSVGEDSPGIASLCFSGSSDTGVLAPLLTIIRSYGPGPDAASCCSNSSNISSSSRLSRNSSDGSSGGGGDSQQQQEQEQLPGEALHERPLRGCSPWEWQQQLEQQQQLSRLIDSMDTVCFLANDDANRRAFVDLGALDLLVGKLQHPPGAGVEGGTLKVQAAALKAISALARHQEEVKQSFWSGPGEPLLLQLLCSRSSNLALTAHAAAGVLAFSTTTSSSSGAVKGGAFTASSSCGANSGSSGRGNGSRPYRLLDERLVGALASALHPNADAAVLLSAIKLLKVAAEVEAGRKAAAGWGSGWRQVLFALVPLLMPSSRQRFRAEVLECTLDLLLALGEQQALRNLICASGCLPPLLVLLLDDSEPHLAAQAGCLLSSLVDCPMCQERLKEEPALVLLLRVLADAPRYSCEVQLASAHLLRRLASGQAANVSLLKAHGAVPVLYDLLMGSHVDGDVRHVAVGLLKALGAPVKRMPSHKLHPHPHHHHHHRACHHHHSHHHHHENPEQQQQGLGLEVNQYLHSL